MKSAKMFAAAMAAVSLIVNVFGTNVEVGHTEEIHQYAEASIEDTVTANDTIEAIVTTTAPADYEVANDAESKTTATIAEMLEPATLQETEQPAKETSGTQTTTTSYCATTASELTTSYESTSTTATTTQKKQPVQYRMFPGESYEICDNVYFTAKKITEFSVEEFDGYIRLSAKNCAWFANISDKATGTTYCPVHYELYQELELAQKNVFAYWGICDGDFYDTRTELIEKSTQIVHATDSLRFGAEGKATKSCEIEVTKAQGYYNLEADDGENHASYLIFDKVNQPRYDCWIHYVDYEQIYNNGEFFVYGRKWDYNFVEWDEAEAYKPEEEIVDEGICQQADLITVNEIDGLALCNMDYVVKKIDGITHVFAVCTDSTDYSAEYIFIPLSRRKDKSQKEMYRNTRYMVVVQETPWSNSSLYSHRDLIAWGEKSQETIHFATGEIKAIGSNCSYYAISDEVLDATHVNNATLLTSNLGWTAMLIVDEYTGALYASDDWKTCFATGITGVACGEIPGHIDTTAHFELNVNYLGNTIFDNSKLNESGKERLSFAPYFRWGDATLTEGVFKFYNQERDFFMGQPDWQVWAELHSDLTDSGNVLDSIGAAAPIEYAPNCRNVLRAKNWRWDISVEIIEDTLTITIDDNLKANATEYTLVLEPATKNSSTTIRWDNERSCYTTLLVYDSRTVDALSRVLYGIDKC